MRRPWTWWLAWAVWCLTLALYAVGITIQQIAGGQNANTEGESWGAQIGLLVAFVGFATVGALVASRQPRNAVGWILGAIALLVSFPLPAASGRATRSSRALGRSRVVRSPGGSTCGRGSRRSR